MKIAKMELFTVKPRWLFLRMETNTGIVGWGEPIVEGRANTVKAAVLEMADYLVGKDPLRIEDHWQVLYRGGFYRGGPILTSAISGIEQALWDIKGKYYEAPIYDMLGGAARDKIKIYGWIGGDRPSDVARNARNQVAAGLTALKMNATEEMHYVDSTLKVAEVVERLQAVKDAVGPGIGIALDFHGRVTKTMAKVLAKALDPLGPMFIEEPVLPENNEALKEIANHTSVPIAVGERMFTRWGFKQLFQDGVVDIIQPDVSHVGGIMELRKVAAMAEAYDVAVAPHCPLGPIALAACLQVDACTPNVFIQEQSLGIHYNTSNDLLDYLLDPAVFRYEGGYVPLPINPGLGIEVDEEKVRAADKEGHNWKNPVWRREDGTVAEW